MASSFSVLGFLLNQCIFLTEREHYMANPRAGAKSGFRLISNIKEFSNYEQFIPFGFSGS